MTTDLRTVRAGLQQTQLQVARRAGMSRLRYFEIEHGKGRPPRPVELRAVADALETTIELIAWPTRDETTT